MKACPLEKYPLQACAAPADGLLICPRVFKESKFSSSVIKVRFRLYTNLARLHILFDSPWFSCGLEKVTIFTLWHTITTPKVCLDHLPAETTSAMMASTQSGVSLFCYLRNIDKMAALISSIDEYLGPAPCFAGFRLTGNEAEILFWDSYLRLAWIHQSTWDIKAEFNEMVEAWLPVVRHTSA